MGSGGIIKTKIENCMVISEHLVCGTLWGEERFLKALCRLVECSFCKRVLEFRFQIFF